MEGIVLTSVDAAVLQSMRTVTQGLGAYLGTGCELILHSLENLQSSAIEVVNGWHSGRQIGAPITDLALHMLEDINRHGEKKPLTYFNRLPNGVTLKSATIPVVGEGERIIGLLCINFYTNISMADFLATFAPTSPLGAGAVSMTEKFSPDVGELIEEAVAEIREDVMQDETIAHSCKNREIVIRLEEKGIFNLKDAVIQVANLLDISKNTVYMHLRNFRK